MAQYIFNMQQLSKIVPPKRKILDNINLAFFPAAKIGVLGLNGAGKSSLMRIMAGIDTEYEGEAIPQKNIKIGYLAQEPKLNNDLDVRGNVESALGEVKEALEELNVVYAAYAEPDADMDALMKKQEKLESIIQIYDGHNLDNQLNIAAEALRLPPWNADVKKISGGEKRRVALCQLLLSKPDMLLLDEPTNHLDAESVAWLERFLHEYTGTVVAITHDRYFLDNVAQWILELDRGSGYPYKGNYSQWLEQKEQRLLQEKNQENSRLRILKQELEWVRSNAKGRQSKSKVRLARFEELSNQEYQKRQQTNEIYIPTDTRLGTSVIEVQNLAKAFGDKTLFDNLSFLVPRGAIVGILGANGAGKSSLFKILIGDEQADKGKVIIGDTVKLAYVDQSRDKLDDKKTLWEEIANGQDMMMVGNSAINSRAYCSRFNFKGNDQQKYIGQLSGGERNRVHLAKTLCKGGNVLLLDEPTNDIDVETLQALENALLEFPGCALIISHDRWFLDRIATHILAFEGNSVVTWFAGNYTEYANDYKKRFGKDVLPSRIKYKAVTK